MANIEGKLGSEKVIVYPSTRRANTRSVSRSIREKNYVDIINKLIDSDGFIISQFDPSSSPLDEKEIEFNIFGYYFKIRGGLNSIIRIMSQQCNYIYAKIELEILTDEFENEYTELKGYDDPLSDSYTGIVFVFTDEPTLKSTSNIKYLKLLEKVNDKWAFAKDSYPKFKDSSLKISRIDGGEI